MGDGFELRLGLGRRLEIAAPRGGGSLASLDLPGAAAGRRGLHAGTRALPNFGGWSRSKAETDEVNPPLLEMNSDKIIQFEALRAKLAADFPAPPAENGGRVPTGVAAFDGSAGGLRRGAVSEFAGSLGSGSLFLEVFFAAARAARCPVGLVDGGCSFEPGDWDPVLLRRVLWVMAAEGRQALKAADLLLRDGNLPMVALDLQGLPEAEVRRIPASTWHRYQRVAEGTETVFVVVTRRPLVEGARVRMVAGSRWGLEAMRLLRSELVARMEVRVTERVVAGPVEAVESGERRWSA